jgi:hypothetical protein
MAQIYKAPEHVEWSDVRNIPKIFFAGSIEMGKAEEWQEKLTDELADLDIVIFNPRRDDFDANQEQSADNPYIREQIEWEREMLDNSDIIAFYFAPNTMSPISLFEVGAYSHKHQEGDVKIIVLCPEGYNRKANVDINCEWDGIPQVNSWEEFVSKIKEALS